jgi:hypothetical protein
LGFPLTEKLRMTRGRRRPLVGQRVTLSFATLRWFMSGGAQKSPRGDSLWLVTKFCATRLINRAGNRKGR